MNDLTEEMFVEGTIKPSNNIKTDFTRPSFLIATCSMLLTLLLWVIAPKWHLIPECFGFYSLGAWTSEVKIKMKYGLIPLIIMAIILPLIMLDPFGFLITGYFTFVWLLGYKLSERRKISHE